MQHQLLEYLNQRTYENWLIGYKNHQLNQLTQEFFEKFTRLSQTKTSVKIFLLEEDPLRFLAVLLAAVAANCPVFLCNPQWKKKEWEQVFNIVQPDLIVGQEKSTDGHFLRQMTNLCNHSSSSVSICRYKIPNQIMIPTGGSSGTIRFALHTLNTLTASVRGFHQYFCRKTINSFCVLPLYHVSGLMQFLRSFLTGGRLAIFPYKALKENLKFLDPRDFFISLVPTQLQFLLESDPTLLSHFCTVLLGGAPAWDSLLETARKHNIRLALTYGMTETAAQVVTLKPENFLAGSSSSGQVLP
ncbi:MAG: AMP-binding protein, partial [Brasilonema sp.]